MPVYDPYSECEIALRASLLELTDFFKKSYQVSSNDTNIARGGDHFIVLRPGSFPIFQEMNTGQVKDYDWTTVVDVYVRYTNYEDSWRQFKALRAALIWKINTNPILAVESDPALSATNVWGVSLSSDENAQYFRFDNSPEDAQPNFIIQTMYATIRQRVEFPFA